MKIRLQSTRGQTVVEFLLISALLVSVFFLFKNEISALVSDYVSQTVASPIEGSHSRGGVPALDQHYSSDLSVRGVK